MLTISLELGLDLRPAAPAMHAAADPVNTVPAGVATKTPQLETICWEPQQKSQQPQGLLQAWQWLPKPWQQREAPLAPSNAVVPIPAAEVLPAEGGPWILCQPRHAYCGVPPALLVGPFASFSNASWVASTPWAEQLCAGLKQQHSPNVSACMPPSQAPGADQLPAQLSLGSACSVSQAPPNGAEPMPRGPLPWVAAAVHCSAASDC